MAIILLLYGAVGRLLSLMKIDQDAVNRLLSADWSVHFYM